MAKAHIDFWFDFASTYSYPAAMRVEALACAHDVAVRWRPFLLGPIFAAQDWRDSPFNIYPAKGRYMWRDLARLCADYGLPFKHPAVFPHNSLLAARVALVGAEATWGPALVRALYTANFADDRDIADRGVIADLLAGLDLDAEAVLTRALSDANKAALKAQVAEAQRLGLFGAPTTMVDQEMFWGDDRLDRAVAWAAARG